MVSPHIECSGPDLPSQTGTVPAIRDANPCDVQIVAKDLSVRVHLLALAAAVVPKEAIGRLLSMAKDCSWNELGGGLPLFLQGFADAIQRPGRSHTSAVDGARLALHVIASSGVRGRPFALLSAMSSAGSPPGQTRRLWPSSRQLRHRTRARISCRRRLTRPQQFHVNSRSGCGDCAQAHVRTSTAAKVNGLPPRRDLGSALANRRRGFSGKSSRVSAHESNADAASREPCWLS